MKINKRTSPNHQLQKKAKKKVDRRRHKKALFKAEYSGHVAGRRRTILEKALLGMKSAFDTREQRQAAKKIVKNKGWNSPTQKERNKVP